MKIDKKAIIAVVLVAVALVVVVYQLRGVVPSPKAAITSTISSAPKAPGAASQPAVAQAGMAAASRDEYETYMADVAESDIDYGSKDFRNPMKPLVSRPTSKKRKPSGPATKVSVGPTNAIAKGYTIEGIVWNEVEPLALVNGQVVSVGENLNDGSLINEITADTVRFTNNGIEYYLVFREE